ncbi:MAG: cob(I)yrinic acid a,c-diamide adenosyltransferase, partial [Candidatus Omnitrophica bacterium]|nr:cob(I)yrinic acid a,c-diamide adenosyltransferase [Candidatus Omnitrophota bacterium]
MIHIYTGDGKGKTTAALGLAIRASGAGKKVFIMQFAKKRPYSELRALKKLNNISINQCGRRCFIRQRPTTFDRQCAQKGLKLVQHAMSLNLY